MEKRVLLVGEPSSFIVNAIQTNLKDSGYEILCEKPDVNAISKITDKPPILLLYLEDDAEKYSDVWIYIRDICVEEEKLLYLIGYQEGVEKVTKIISEAMIRGTFGRPLNIKVLVEHLEDTVQKIDKEPKKKHILIVDDSGQMLRAVKSWLSDKYQVSMANSGMNAITFLANNKPDLILLDYEMPVCPGPQIMEMIRSESSTSNIPIIFLTSKGDKESVMKVMNLKPEGYLLKTMSPAKIVNTIDQFFETKKAEAVQNLSK